MPRRTMAHKPPAKKFLRAGLLSREFKIDEETAANAVTPRKVVVVPFNEVKEPSCKNLVMYKCKMCAIMLEHEVDMRDHVAGKHDHVGEGDSPGTRGWVAVTLKLFPGLTYPPSLDRVTRASLTTETDNTTTTEVRRTGPGKIARSAKRAKLNLEKLQAQKNSLNNGTINPDESNNSDSGRSLVNGTSPTTSKDLSAKLFTITMETETSSETEGQARSVASLGKMLLRSRKMMDNPDQELEVSGTGSSGQNCKEKGDLQKKKPNGVGVVNGKSEEIVNENASTRKKTVTWGEVTYLHISPLKSPNPMSSSPLLLRSRRIEGRTYPPASGKRGRAGTTNGFSRVGQGKETNVFMASDDPIVNGGVEDVDPSLTDFVNGINGNGKHDLSLNVGSENKIKKYQDMNGSSEYDAGKKRRLEDTWETEITNKDQRYAAPLPRKKQFLVSFTCDTQNNGESIEGRSNSSDSQTDSLDSPRQSTDDQLDIGSSQTKEEQQSLHKSPELNGTHIGHHVENLTEKNSEDLDNIVDRKVTREEIEIIQITVSCPECQAKFTSLGDMRLHIIQDHTSCFQDNQLSITDWERIKSQIDLGPGTTSCPFPSCNSLEFPKFAVFIDHLRIFHNNVEENHEEEEKEEIVTLEIGNGIEGTAEEEEDETTFTNYYCLICDKYLPTITKNSQMRAHMRTHHIYNASSSSSYCPPLQKCDKCPDSEIYPSKELLWFHQISHHSEIWEELMFPFERDEFEKAYCFTKKGTQVSCPFCAKWPMDFHTHFHTMHWNPSAQ